MGFSVSKTTSNAEFQHKEDCLNEASAEADNDTHEVEEEEFAPFLLYLPYRLHFFVLCRRRRRLTRN